jgi:hypothetical protein
MVRRLPIAVLALAAAGVADAQVYKCVDGQGRTTYQQEPCAKTEKGARVDLLPDNGSTRDAAALEAQWAAAAKQGQVVTGMPKRYVQAAYGAPSEMRGGSATDRVSEVWVYRNAGGTRRVGFLDGRVAFDRGDDGGSGPPATQETGDLAARRDAAGTPVAARRSIQPGRDCGSVIAEAGRPDRSEGFQVGTSSGVSAGMRHFYDDDGSQPPQPMAFTCVNGLVQNVERNAR